MNCKQAQASLSAYQDKELSRVETSALEAHLKNCGPCKAELQRITQTWDMLGSLAAIKPSADFKSRFWERVRQEEVKPRLWDWVALPRLLPALAGLMALWVLGVGSGLLLFEHQAKGPVPETSAALSIFTSSYPPNSIEQIYLEGRNGGRHV